MKKTNLLDGQEISYEIKNKTEDSVIIVLNGTEYQILKNDISKKVVSAPPVYLVNGKEFKVESKSLTRSKVNQTDHGHMIAPMPGKILKIYVLEGAEVKAGTPILVMEAMKMEHTIKASKDGKIEKIHFKENVQVSAGAELVTLC